ncbi:hypothetical protein M9Y10_013287 [Tritrichomonas musculus]|uniref:Uncharacterized protein n=1 Tax=Tritrichomonas musculus TaxID=1915356 RepID=A0ABR2GPA0_9EUKA
MINAEIFGQFFGLEIIIYPMSKAEVIKNFFPDWKYEILKAKDIGYLPSDCVCHISCVNCAPNRIAYGSDNLSSIYFSEISDPNSHIVKVETEDKLLGIEWLPVEPYHILATFEKNLVIIDTKEDKIIHQAAATDPTVYFIDAHWTKNGNIISLSQKNAMTFYDNELNNHHQLNSLESGKSFCFSIDNDQLYVGQHRDVLIFDISTEGEMKKLNSFVAHPHDIVKIQILNNHLITVTDKSAVIWDKRDLVPLFSIVSEGSAFYADPTCTFAIDSNKQIFKLAKGPKSEIKRTMDLNTKDPIKAAAWQYCENEDEKILHIGSHNSNEFCLALVIRFTRK